MAVLTADRNTAERHSPGRAVSYPIAANVRIFAGALVSLVAGFAAPASDTAATFVVGVADESINNLGGAAGAFEVTVVRGKAFKLANNAGAIVAADRGKNALVIDDQTVTDAATTNNIVAGQIETIDDDGGIWVYIA